jgi:membrane AbrB-like protein
MPARDQPASTPAADIWRRWPWLGLLACAAGGALCALVNTPLPWMIGSLTTMAVLRFSGVPVTAPRGCRATGQVVIGTALGIYFTPMVGREVLGHWEIVLATALFSMVLAYVCAWFIWRLGDVDRTTALFASVPGGAAEMANLGERYGAKVDRIAVAQSLRVLVVVIAVPFAMTGAGVAGSDDSYMPPDLPLDWAMLGALLGAAVLGGAFLRLVRSPNPFMLGPLLVTIALTVTGHEWSNVPGWMTSAAQVMLGCSLGQRFEREFLSAAPRFVSVVTASIVLAMVLSALFAIGLALAVGVPAATVILATAPGGIAEMCLTAKALRLGVPLVTAAHVARVVLLVTLTAPVFRVVRAGLRRFGT